MPKRMKVSQRHFSQPGNPNVLVTKTDDALLNYLLRINETINHKRRTVYKDYLIGKWQQNQQWTLLINVLVMIGYH